MTEDKQEICNLLLKTLQATAYYSDLVDMEHCFTADGQHEFVIVTHADGWKERVNVTRVHVPVGRGITMIRDILKQIM